MFSGSVLSTQSKRSLLPKNRPNLRSDILAMIYLHTLLFSRLSTISKLSLSLVPLPTTQPLDLQSRADPVLPGHRSVYSPHIGACAYREQALADRTARAFKTSSLPLRLSRRLCGSWAVESLAQWSPRFHITSTSQPTTTATTTNAVLRANGKAGWLAEVDIRIHSFIYRILPPPHTFPRLSPTCAEKCPVWASAQVDTTSKLAAKTVSFSV
ncbi:hypothetical protein Ddc_10234 [Ditylenchus destructor]|nr:hypothetical protein Ddc_10234 [Ditylenchus destructor]